MLFDINLSSPPNDRGKIMKSKYSLEYINRKNIHENLWFKVSPSYDPLSPSSQTHPISLTSAMLMQLKQKASDNNNKMFNFPLYFLNNLFFFL